MPVATDPNNWARTCVRVVGEFCKARGGLDDVMDYANVVKLTSELRPTAAVVRPLAKACRIARALPARTVHGSAHPRR